MSCEGNWTALLVERAHGENILLFLTKALAAGLCATAVLSWLAMNALLVCASLCEAAWNAAPEDVRRRGEAVAARVSAISAWFRAKFPDNFEDLREQ